MYSLVHRPLPNFPSLAAHLIVVEKKQEARRGPGNEANLCKCLIENEISIGSL